MVYTKWGILNTNSYYLYIRRIYKGHNYGISYIVSLIFIILVFGRFHSILAINVIPERLELGGEYIRGISAALVTASITAEFAKAIAYELSSVNSAGSDLGLSDRKISMALFLSLKIFGTTAVVASVKVARTRGRTNTKEGIVVKFTMIYNERFNCWG